MAKERKRLINEDAITEIPTKPRASGRRRGRKEDTVDDSSKKGVPGGSKVADGPFEIVEGHEEIVVTPEIESQNPEIEISSNNDVDVIQEASQDRGAEIFGYR